MKHSDNSQYYPSNGTEGEGFIYTYCVKCKRDPHSRNGKSKTGCSIIYKSLCGVKPKQWIYKDGNPTCTAFIDLKAKPKTHRKNKSQLELI